MPTLLKQIFTAVCFCALALFNFWIFWIFEYSFILGELLIIQAFLLYLIYEQKIKSFCALLILLMLLTGVPFTIKNFDKNIFNISTTETTKINQRREYYAKELGKLYRNKIGLGYFEKIAPKLVKLSENLFFPLDFGFYFSPAKTADLSKFPFILSPFFIIGVLLLIKDGNRIHSLYFIFALIIGSLSEADFKIGPVMIYPLLVLCIAIGFKAIITKVFKF